MKKKAYVNSSAETANQKWINLGLNQGPSIIKRHDALRLRHRPIIYITRLIESRPIDRTNINEQK